MISSMFFTQKESVNTGMRDELEECNKSEILCNKNSSKDI